MKNTTTFGLRHDDESLVWLRVEPGVEDGWKLAQREQAKLGSDALQNAVQDDQLQEVNGVGVLPGTSVKMAITRIPRLKGKEMKRAIIGWAAREEGVQADEIAVTWRLFDEEQPSPDGTVSVFMAYAQNKTVGEAMNAYSSVGLQPDCLLPDFMVLDQFLRTTRPDLEELKAWAVVHLDRQEGFVSISTGQSLLLHRALPRDLAQGADDEDYVGRLSTEIFRSLSFARQTEHNPDIGNIFISGEDSLAKLLTAELQTTQHIPVTPWGVAERVDCSTEDCGPQMTLTVAAAVVAGLGGLRYNLLPGRRRNTLSARARRRLTVAVAGMAVVGIPVFVALSLMAQHRDDSRLQETHARWQMMQPAITAAMDADRSFRIALEREKIISAHGTGSEGLEDLLLGLAAVTPSQVHFETLKITLSDGKTILQVTGDSIDGKNAGAQQAFLEFLAALDGTAVLERTGQPGKLIIGEVSKDDSRRKQVLFSLEYLVNMDKRREG